MTQPEFNKKHDELVRRYGLTGADFPHFGDIKHLSDQAHLDLLEGIGKAKQED